MENCLQCSELHLLRYFTQWMEGGKNRLLPFISRIKRTASLGSPGGGGAENNAPRFYRVGISPLLPTQVLETGVGNKDQSQ